MSDKEVKIPIEEAAIYAKQFVLPIIALFTIPYLIYNRGLTNIEIKSYLYFYNLYSNVALGENFFPTLISPIKSLLSSFNHFGWLILSLFPAIIIHELLHAFAAIVFSKGKLNAVKFGFDKKTLSPYTHCKNPLYVWQYRIVLVLPGVILGILPGFLGSLFKSPEMVVFGIIYTIGALGDFLMITILKKYNSKTRIKDHPTTLGFFIVE